MKTGLTDSVREVLKHGTLSIGGGGLVALAPDRQPEPGLRGLYHGGATEKLNYTGNPEEGLSGRFVRIEQKSMASSPA